jgi:hypothetical protein
MSIRHRLVTGEIYAAHLHRGIDSLSSGETNVALFSFTCESRRAAQKPASHLKTSNRETEYETS